MFAEYIEPMHVGLAASLLIPAYFIVPYLLDPHDYRRFPGPTSAAFSNAWLAWTVHTGKRQELVHKAHLKYGKYVRIGPNHVSIADPDALDPVYGHGSALLKSDFYDVFKFQDPDLFSTDRGDHTMRRKRVANLFSHQNILVYEPRVRRHIRQLCIEWDKRCQAASKGLSGENWKSESRRVVLECVSQFVFLSLDIISDLALGSPFDMATAQGDSAPVVQSLVAAAEDPNCPTVDLPVAKLLHSSGNFVMTVGCFPTWMQPILRFMPWNSANAEGHGNAIGMAIAAANARIKRGSSEKQEDNFESERSSKKGIDIIDKLLEVRDERGNPLSHQDLLGECIVFLIAGGDTTGNSLSAVCYYLAKYPAVQRKLQAELDAEVPLKPELDDDTQHDSVPFNVVTGYERVKNLPYLNACVKEVMRVHSTVGFGLPRVVPSGKTLRFDGYTFGAGSVVSVPFYTTNQANVWGESPEEFRPERWLEEGANSMNKYYAPFSLGSRACIGRNLANMDLIITVATVFRRYDVQLTNPSEVPFTHETFERRLAEFNISVKRRIL
ncbi:hypothetical protein FRC11_006578 [Ceratobasidium sp. 423]|nr:hypothetical protein FRC11_006578 [Ceratobasidium sp. 423]